MTWGQNRAPLSSEMNCCAVVTNEETTEKSYIWSECLFPKVSIVDPALTCSLPAYQTTCGAADTISHVMEFYINGLEGTPLNNRIQESVILTVMENVPLALEDPDDIDARANLQWASIVALNGWSQPGDAWTPVHQVGHVLSARYGVTHGASLSIVMPAWMRHLHTKRPDRYVQFAERVFDINVAGRDEGKSLVFQSRDLDDRMDDLRTAVGLIVKGITSGMFFPYPEGAACRNCDYADACTSAAVALATMKNGDHAASFYVNGLAGIE